MLFDNSQNYKPLVCILLLVIFVNRREVAARDASE